MIKSKLKRHSTLICLTLGLISCRSEKINFIKVTEFPKHSEITLESIDVAEKLDDPSRIFCYGDTIVMIDNNSPRGLLAVVSAKESKVEYILHKGRGPKELLSAWFLSSSNSNGDFWVFDVVAADILKVNLRGISQDWHSALSDKTTLKGEAFRALSADILNDSVLICVGRFEDCRVVKTDLKGNVIGKAGVCPSLYKKDGFDISMSEAYQGTIKRKPDGSKYVIACKYADQIEIFDAQNDGRQTFVKGPSLAEPVYEVINVGKTGAMAMDREKSIEGYTDVAVTDEYIIGLFSGKKLSEKDAIHNDKLNIFDWDGNPIAQYILDNKCLSLCVSPISNRVYLLSLLPIPEIYYFDLDI